MLVSRNIRSTSTLMSRTMLMGTGKPASRVDANSTTIAAVNRGAGLLKIYDHIHNLHFLVDTGASISVVPPRQEDLKHIEDDLNLTAANGTVIATYGERLINLNIGLRRKYSWIFIVADVTQPILGADFLAHYNLTVNLAHQTVTDHLTPLSTTLCGNHQSQQHKSAARSTT